MQKLSLRARLPILLIAGACISLFGTLLGVQSNPLIVALADGFLLSGVLLLSVHILSYVSSRGGCDIFFYSLRALGSVLTGSPVSDYHNYKARKTRKAASRELLIVGLLYLFLSVAFSLSALRAM